MEKNINKDDVYYKIEWSQGQLFDRHTVSGIPILPGIACLYQEKGGLIDYLLFYSCWKNGIRIGLRNILDPDFSEFSELIELSKEKELFFRYAVVDTHFLDVQDILYWLIREYDPLYNNISNFTDSKRYKDIYLKETWIIEEY
jgi:hypothetical protein